MTQENKKCCEICRGQVGPNDGECLVPNCAYCHQQNQEKVELKKILGEKAHITKEYGMHYSHYHCWDQEGSPACGIALEKHTQCCLCDTPTPQLVLDNEEYNKQRDIAKPENQERDEWVEIVKSIMFADDVDWELSLQNEGITYLKSYQLHGKIKEVISNLLHKQREELVGKIKDMIEMRKSLPMPGDEKEIELLNEVLALLANPKGDE